MRRAEADGGPRRLWLTLSLHAVLFAVLALDVWGAVFWWRVGGQLGTALAVAGAVVAVGLAAVVATDLRRQWFLRRSTAETSTPAGAAGDPSAGDVHVPAEPTRPSGRHPNG